MGAACCGCCGPSTNSHAISSVNTHQRVPHDHSDSPRFTDITVSTIDHSKLIEGYEKEPLLPLEQALEPLQGKIDQLSYYIQEAKRKCYHPSKHPLTKDESAAIYIYTMKLGKESLHDHVQGTLQTGEKSEVKLYFKYFKLFKAGLSKLPDAKGEIWQVTGYNERDKQLLTSDSQPLYVSMGSCSPSEEELKKTLGKDSAGRKIFVGYGLFVKGKVITGYTANNYEEVLVWPGGKVGKADAKSDPDGTLFIHFTRRYKHYPEAISPKTDTAGQKHFVCPYRGCGNRCPADHEGDHCRSFATLIHICQHHCHPLPNKCDKCHQSVHKLCKCYRCGSSYCEKCCF